MRKSNGEEGESRGVSRKSNGDDEQVLIGGCGEQYLGESLVVLETSLSGDIETDGGYFLLYWSIDEVEESCR